MGDKIISFISIGTMVLILLILMSVIITDYQQDMSISLIDDFVENVRYKGYITLNDYEKLIKQLPLKNIRINMIHMKANDYGKDVIDAVFNKQIFGDQHTSNTLLCSNGTEAEKNIYKFNVNDIFQIDLINLERTPLDIFAGKNVKIIKLITTRSGMIVNTKY